jgi:hypothetical protein
LGVFVSLDETNAARAEILETYGLFLEGFVAEQYAKRLGSSHAIVKMLARMHFMLWRKLIEGDSEQMMQMQRGLMRHLDLHGVDVAVMEEIDRAIVDELIDLVALRHRNSARALAAFNMAIAASVRTLSNAKRAA